VYKGKILIVDTDPTLYPILEKRLTIIGYKVFLASNGYKALAIFKNEQPHLIILDILLPGLDGFEVCKKLREKSQIPIIILTALANLSDRIMGLELGADDYLIKPFSLKELEIKIRYILKRTDIQPQTKIKRIPSIYKLGNVIINFDKSQVLKENLVITLTSTESRLLELLIENAGERLPRTTIISSLWGYIPEREVDMRIVDVHISRLRAKLEDNPGKPNFILTARGEGYIFSM